jgi:hypothetical protein
MASYDRYLKGAPRLESGRPDRSRADYTFLAAGHRLGLEHHRDGEFGSRFIALARSVYQLNDQRAAIKRRINEWCGSPWMEQKEYPASDNQ